MPLKPLDDIFVKKIPPAPIHESIIGDGNRATTAFIRYLTDAYKSDRNIYEEVNKVIDQVNLNLEQINSIKIGAGLDDNGDYLVPIDSNFIDDTISLYNAILALDISLFDETRELVSTVVEDTLLSANSQTTLCDATSGEINITLPNPALCFSDNRSFRFAIHKIDISANVVNILPFGAELVVGEASQTLELDGEIYNFITDGTNWYLGA